MNSPASAHRLPRILRPLAHRDFALLWGGQLISLAGDFALGVAIPFQILALGGGPVEIGIELALVTSGQLLLLLFGGTLVDRISRRRVILTCDLASAVVVGAIAILGFTGALRIEHIYAQALYLGIVRSFLYPAIGAVVPELLPAELLTQGASLRALSRQLALILGPLLAGLAIAGFGFPAAFGLDSLTFLLGFLAFALARPRPAPERVVEPFLAQLSAGLRFTFSVQWLWVTIFGWSLLIAGRWTPFNVALPVFVGDVLGESAQTYGAIVSLVAVAQAVGALAIGQLAPTRSGIGMYGAAAIGGVGVALIGFVPAMWATLVGTVILGASGAATEALWVPLLQRRVPRELLGRVMAIDSFGSVILGPFSPILVGSAAATFGPAPVLVVGGLTTVALAAMFLSLRSIRELRNE